jgi:hypothetical protein
MSAMSSFVFSAQSNQTLPATEKPPDPHQQPPPKISFRDKLLGPSQETLIREKEDMIEKKLVRIEHENGNRLLPKVHLEPAVFQELCTPWKDAIVVKLLGKNIGYHTMRERLQKTWRTQGGFEIMDNDNGFFMVKFDEAADKEKVITGGPWLIFDHCLAVAHWTPEFASPTATVDKTIVWVRFPGLNLVYYDESFLLAMASALGRPIKVDTNTLKIERGKFARVCVEIDLTLPVVGKIWVNGHWYKVQYEGLHLICTSCGCYGHLGRNCSTMPAKNNTTMPPSQPAETNFHEDSQKPQQPGPNSIDSQLIPESQNGKAITVFTQESLANDDRIICNAGENNELHGDWLVVTRKKRVPNNTTLFSSKTITPKGNRFNALANITDSNKTAPHNQTALARPAFHDQPHALHIPKVTKRPRHDHDNLTDNHMPIIATHKAPIKNTYVAKKFPQISNSQKATNDSHKHVPPARNIPAHAQKLNHIDINTSSPIHAQHINHNEVISSLHTQTEPAPNNPNETQNRDTNERDQHDTFIPTDKHGTFISTDSDQDLQHAHDEDMVT